MKNSSLKWTLLVLMTFIFFGVDNIFPGNSALMVKAVCLVGACADVYYLAVSYEKMLSERRNSFAELEKMGDEQKRQIEEYLKTLREEQEDILAGSNEKLGNLVEKLIYNESEYLQKFAAMTENMAEKNRDVIRQAMAGVRESLDQENENRNRYFEKLDQKLSAGIQGMIDVQNKNMDTTAALLKSNEKAFGNAMDAVRELSAVQEELVSKEKEVRNLNEKVLRDINSAMDGFVQVSGAVKDEVAALKAYMKAFKDKVEAKLEEHYENVEDAVEDGNDDLRDILEKSGKNQVKAFSDQTNALTECVAHIETVIHKAVSEVTERNDRLLSDLERMQDEWTNLNKTEIEFLGRIWEEQ